MRLTSLSSLSSSSPSSPSSRGRQRFWKNHHHRHISAFLLFQSFSPFLGGVSANHIINPASTTTTAAATLSSSSSSSSSSTPSPPSKKIHKKKNKKKKQPFQKDQQQEIMSATTTGDKNSSELYTIGGGAVNEKKRLYPSLAKQNNNNNNKTTKATTRRDANNQFDPLNNPAHLMHAMEGLHRYPNYLARWNHPQQGLKDMDALEGALLKQLQKVQHQKQMVQQHQQDMKRTLERVFLQEEEEEGQRRQPDNNDNNTIHHHWKEWCRPPQSWEELFRRDILDDRAKQALMQSTWYNKNKKNKSLGDVLRGEEMVAMDASQLEILLDEECFDTYSFPLLHPTFCRQLFQFEQVVMDEYQSEKQRHNNDDDEGTMLLFSSLNAPIRDLDNLGLDWVNDLIFHVFVRPISKQLYSETELIGGGGDLDWRHGYIAAYAAKPTEGKPRQRLVPHTDDSEVTLNVCLGDVFEGGNLNLWGLRGNRKQQQRQVGAYEPQVGRALLHSGRHLHEVTEITSGNRYAYIMWARSWGATRATTCPCCWLNNRDPSTSSCICGAAWN